MEPEQYVVVETAQGIEYVKCVEGNHQVDDESVVQPLRPVVRIATDNDHKAAAYNRRREKEAFAICEKKIAAHKLEMKLVSVECNFEGNKIIFFFTAEGRVDFRELVKDLASVFRARIELRQIGVRDEAKMLGGLGICGRPLCCSQFLEEFIPVSIKMAKTQNLSLNPTKISGACGRLMCCLKYEQHAYEEAAKNMPKNESFVDTPDGVGNISAVDLLREEVTVRLDNAPESPKRYKRCEIRVLRNGKGSREGIEIPGERPARFVPESAAADEPRPPRRLSSVGRVSPVPVEPDEEEPIQEEKRDRSRRRPPEGPGRQAQGRPRRAGKGGKVPGEAGESHGEKGRGQAPPPGAAGQGREGGEGGEAHRPPDHRHHRREEGRRRPGGGTGPPARAHPPPARRGNSPRAGPPPSAPPPPPGEKRGVRCFPRADCSAARCSRGLHPRLTPIFLMRLCQRRAPMRLDSPAVGRVGEKHFSSE